MSIELSVREVEQEKKEKRNIERPQNGNDLRFYTTVREETEAWQKRRAYLMNSQIKRVNSFSPIGGEYIW